MKLALHDCAWLGVIQMSFSPLDCLTGEPIILPCEYPKGSFQSYLFGGTYWIGAVVGSDTLVSTGMDGWNVMRGDELRADVWPFNKFQHRSIMDPNAPEYVGAVSEEDFLNTFTDTVTEGVLGDYFYNRPHIPLGIEITQTSMAWSYAYAEDFILFDLGIKNIGDNVLRGLYLGLYMDPDIGVLGGPVADDICGFLRQVASPFGCAFVDTVNIAWGADNDGDPIEGEWVIPPRRVPISGALEGSAPHVTGTCVLDAPTEIQAVSFNWWISNYNPSLEFGPMRRDKVRDFRTGGIGSPHGDVNKYYVLSNNEFDYDQAFTASISPFDERWLYPNQEHAADWADGFDTRYLLSYGAFTV
jgi:hypothetical protein